MTCHWCGRQTHSPIRICRDCVGVEARKDMQPDPNDALRGGRWVPRRGVLVWAGPRPTDDPQVKTSARCGTDSGYHHHVKRAKTEPCGPCKAAHSAAERNRTAA